MTVILHQVVVAAVATVSLSCVFSASANASSEGTKGHIISNRMMNDEATDNDGWAPAPPTPAWWVPPPTHAPTPPSPARWVPPPTHAPTYVPSYIPTNLPTNAPTRIPTKMPTNTPLQLPLISEIAPNIMMEYGINILDASALVGVRGDTLSVRITYETEEDGWVGFAISNDGRMLNAEAIIAFPGGNIVPKKYLLGGYNSGAVREMDSERQTLLNASVERVGGNTIMQFTKLLREEGEIEIVKDGITANNFLWAFGESNELAYHGSNNRGGFELALEEGPPVSDLPIQFPKAKVLSDKITVDYGVNVDSIVGVQDDTLSVQLTYEGEGWVAFAVSKDKKMLNAEAIIGIPGEGVQKYLLGGYTSAAVQPADTARQTLINPSIEQADGRTTLRFTKLLKEEGEIEILKEGDNNFLWAMGTSNTLAYHGFNNRGSFVLPLDGSEPVQPLPTPLPTPAPPTPSGGVNCAEDFQFSTDLSPNLKMDFTVYNPEDAEDGATEVQAEAQGGVLRARLTYNGLGWVALAFSTNGRMVGSEAVIGIPGGDGVPQKYNLGGLDVSQVQPMSPERQTLMDHSIEQVNGQTILTFTKLLKEEGEIEINPDGQNQFLWAFGSGNSLAYHGPNRAPFALGLQTCIEGGDSGSIIREQVASADERMWRAHGIMALVAWGFLTPMAIAASWMRDLIGGPLWFRIHMFFNSLTFLLTISLFGVAVAVFSRNGLPHFQGGLPSSSHTRMGLAMFILVCIQVIGGFARPHLPPSAPPAKDPADAAENGSANSPPEKPRKSTVRIVWEVVHKTTGVALLASGLWQINRGLELYRGKGYPVFITQTAFWIWIGAFLGTALLLTASSKIFASAKSVKAKESSKRDRQDSAGNVTKSESVTDVIMIRKEDCYPM